MIMVFLRLAVIAILIGVMSTVFPWWAIALLFVLIIICYLDASKDQL